MQDVNLRVPMMPYRAYICPIGDISSPLPFFSPATGNICNLSWVRENQGKTNILGGIRFFLFFNPEIHVTMARLKTCEVYQSQFNMGLYSENKKMKNPQFFNTKSRRNKPSVTIHQSFVLPMCTTRNWNLVMIAPLF